MLAKVLYKIFLETLNEEDYFVFSTHHAHRETAAKRGPSGTRLIYHTTTCAPI